MKCTLDILYFTQKSTIFNRLPQKEKYSIIIEYFDTHLNGHKIITIIVLDNREILLKMMKIQGFSFHSLYFYKKFSKEKYIF